ncbi:MAG: hypothetical protein RLZZ524_3214 [Pseudomonadota bacterium]
MKSKAAQEPCFCDRMNIGEPGVSCGDCPTRDYKPTSGWKLVPVEPTPEMMKCADFIMGADPRFMRMTWQAMLAVAPQLVAWHNPRADILRDALREIADSKNLTATSAQFARHLQRLASKALTEDAMSEPHPPQA